MVPILGMHRSGTSMFTRALNLMGVDLGEPLIEAQDDNPKGFWENEFFYNSDMRILHGLGLHVSGYGRAAQLLEVPALSARMERTTDNLTAIERYLEDQFCSSPVWGWKDPRSVLVFPFWLSSLVELGFRRLRPTVIVRHPAAVIRSLAGRTDLDAVAATLDCSAEQLALEMWTAYSHLLLDIADETDCYISLHEWFLEPETAAGELARCAEAIGLRATEAQMDAALAWLDPGAVHHRDPPPLAGRTADEALLLWADLMSRAISQRAVWQGNTYTD